MIEEINKLLKNSGIETFELRENKQACEKYIYTRFKQDSDKWIDTMVPYVYRRSGLYMDTPEEIAEYLKSIKSYFLEDYINKWCTEQISNIEGKDYIYTNFLRILLKESKCREIVQDRFPQNNNRQKIFQKIKDRGFVISILRGRKKENGGKTRYWLLPIPLAQGTIYETMSEEFTNYVKRTLGNIDAYDNRWMDGLIPDHKFSEIRWDVNTPEKNSTDMSEEKIKAKFQLLTTQRNQQKREVCRNCYRTGERGTIFGIKFFYEGTEKWNPAIPQRGKDAELGCKGCPWYDINKWREKLQEKINLK